MLVCSCSCGWWRGLRGNKVHCEVSRLFILCKSSYVSEVMYLTHVSLLYCSIFGNEKRHSGNKSPWKPVREWAGDTRSVVPGTGIEYPGF